MTIARIDSRPYTDIYWILHEQIFHLHIELSAIYWNSCIIYVNISAISSPAQ